MIKIALLTDIGTYIQAQGEGNMGTDIFLGNMPESPDTCVALFEYQGERPAFTYTGEEIRQPGLQVRVRNASYAACAAKIESIRGKLHLLTNTILNGTTYLGIIANHEAFPLGRDDNGRSEFVLNFSVKIAR